MNHNNNAACQDLEESGISLYCNDKCKIRDAQQ